MSEYYAVQRPTDHLAHYGIRGMKWGVRKAIHKGTDKVMKKQYKKAQKKLNELNKRTDLKYQENEIKYHRKKAIQSGLATAGLSGITDLGVKNTKWLLENSPVEYLHTNVNPHLTVEKIKPSALARHSTAMTALSGVGALGSAVKTGYHIGSAIASKHLTTKAGHEKAVAKRNAWEKEMRAAFKGTKYANQIGVANNQNKKKKKRR